MASRHNLEIHVFYTWGKSVLENKYDPGFGKNINWDIPLLQGYNFTFLQNNSAAPGSHHFRGIDNPELIDKVSSWNPDAILVYGWAFRSHLRIMKYFKNKLPVLFRGDSTLLDKENILKKNLKKVWLKQVYKNVSYALYTGVENFNYYKNYGLKESQLIHAPHAIENKRFEEGAFNSAIDFRKNLNIPEDEFVFLFSGKLEEKKNPLLLLNAFKKFSLYNSAHLVIVGNGPLEEKVKDLSAAIPNVHLLPFQNQKAMPYVYAMADCFVLPSGGPGESWGLAVNEAFATGLPAIVSDKCGCAEDLIISGKTGYIFQSGSETSLSDAMIRMIQMGGKKRLNENCKAHIQNFSLESIAIQIEDLMKKIAPGKEGLKKVNNFV